MIAAAQLEAAAAWAYSSVVEHCVDIAGVASSILATPTIFLLDVNCPPQLLLGAMPNQRLCARLNALRSL